MNIYQDEINSLNENYKIWLSNNIEPMVEFETQWMKDNEYTLNNHGLRCDNFYKIENKKDHILFAGCEYSLAINHEVKFSWAYMLYSYLLGSVGTYRNISYPGANPEKIIANLIKYVDAYGAPYKMFVLMPEIIRDYGYWPDGKVYKPKMYRQLKGNGGVEHNDVAIPNDVPLNLLLLSYVRSIRILESYCSALEIDLIWTTWDKDSSEILSQMDFKYFFPAQINPDDQNDIYNHFVKQIKENR